MRDHPTLVPMTTTCYAIGNTEAAVGALLSGAVGQLIWTVMPATAVTAAEDTQTQEEIPWKFEIAEIMAVLSCHRSHFALCGLKSELARRGLRPSAALRP